MSVQQTSFSKMAPSAAEMAYWKINLCQSSNGELLFTSPYQKFNLQSTDEWRHTQLNKGKRHFLPPKNPFKKSKYIVPHLITKKPTYIGGNGTAVIKMLRHKIAVVCFGYYTRILGTFSNYLLATVLVQMCCLLELITTTNKTLFMLIGYVFLAPSKHSFLVVVV